ncbi:murein L,D-transpeptidase [Streptomyces sp. AJS327]|uniref:L,D-transpeptidase n=1 Tax=Streptomyces sp. AJS327 TaxID=2545265 RepID=UPI0015DED7B5|nr:L,D-transpeptidase [Streptomyces sp. AJS327]MBA0051659.1 murein L,D-transpeptidase [Streptomyces sp. AJS327]
MPTRPGAAPSPVPAVRGARPVPDADLVPGHPSPPEAPYQRDTPDQGKPRDPEPEGPGVAPPPPNPGPEAVDPGFAVEYVPPGEQVQRAGGKVRCSRSTGVHQRVVERYLKLPVDGVQSRRDCLRIQRFQKNAGIRPANGFAGPVTYRLVLLRLAKRDPARLKRCPPAAGRTACLDLTRQYMWVREGRRVVLGPVPMRTGTPRHPTRTGRFRVHRKVRDEWSRPYDSPMPFSQYFSGGQAIHGIYKNIFSRGGSHGCVNLRYTDARRLWRVLKVGDRVHIWGRKPRV